MIFRASAVAVALLQITSASPIEKSNASNSTLQWAPCTLQFPSAHQAVIDAHGFPLLCANLKVPLDYTNPKNGRTIELQLLKVEATKQPAKGSVIMNPGGPGSSGIEEISKFGPMYVETLGGGYNVIGFDVRGTGKTLPIQCNPTNNSTSPLQRREANITIPQNDMYSVLKTKAWHDAKLYVDACASTESVAAVAPFIGTAFAARDVISIVDALGEDGLVRFWGRSYSSVLGQTLAAMFPDRVGRILLDSVLDADDYFSGHWATATRDTEKTLLNAFRECLLAGPQHCPSANFSGPDTSVESLRSGLADALQGLMDSSITVPADSILSVTQPWWQPGISLYQAFKMNILSALYKPGAELAFLWALLDVALKRDWENYVKSAYPPLPTNISVPPSELPWNIQSAGGNFHAIGCSDSSFRADKPEDLYSLIQTQKSQGSWADVFSAQIWVCAQWRFKAVERYEKAYSGIKTRHPLLMISGTFDPITPLSGAWKVSADFLGSRLVEHRGHGHGVMNHRSNCTIKAIHDYFNDGVLPEVGTVCKPNQPAHELAIEAAEAAAALQNSTAPP